MSDFERRSLEREAAHGDVEAAERLRALSGRLLDVPEELRSATWERVFSFSSNNRRPVVASCPGHPALGPSETWHSVSCVPRILSREKVARVVWLRLADDAHGSDEAHVEMHGGGHLYVRYSAHYEAGMVALGPCAEAVAKFRSDMIAAERASASTRATPFFASVFLRSSSEDPEGEVDVPDVPDDGDRP